MDVSDPHPKETGSLGNEGRYIGAEREEKKTEATPPEKSKPTSPKLTSSIRR